MKVYEGRLTPFTETDYLAAGFSAKSARELSRASEVRVRGRISARDGDRRYELTHWTKERRDDVFWGYKGAGTKAAAQLIADDLDVREVDRRLLLDAVYELLLTRKREHNFDLAESEIWGRLSATD
jgi:hypothetical protein